MTIFKNIDIKTPIMLCVNYALYLLFIYLNDACSSFSIYFFCASLFVIPPALFLGFGGMCVCALFSGFLFEQGLPVNTGVLPVIFLVSATWIHRIREKFRSLDPAGILGLSWILNLAMYLFACLFAFPSGMDSAWLFIMRTGADLIFSSTIIVLLANFILRLHVSVFYIIGINLTIAEDV